MWAQNVTTQKYYNAMQHSKTRSKPMCFPASAFYTSSPESDSDAQTLPHGVR
jgi:hypothetical protein